MARVGTATFPISADIPNITGVAVKSAEDEVNRIVTEINNAGYVLADAPAFTATVTSTNGASFHTDTAPPAGGSTARGINLGSTANFGLFYGSGAPSLNAAKGSLYIRTDGTTTNDRFYISLGAGTWTAGTTAS